MTAAVLLDHVSAYAAAVRAHLHDLSPEQVDDLTDGLEADLAAALEDGPAEAGATDDPQGSHTLDLTRRFGPAAEYAAELRVAAGLSPASAPRPRMREVLAERRQARRERWRTRADQVTGPVTAHRYWPAVREFGVSLRPAWWLLRAWVWYVVLVWVFQLVTGSGQALVPTGVGTALLLVGLVVLSVNLGRDRLPVPVRLHRPVRWATVGAAVLALPLLLALADRVDSGPYGYETVVYQETYQEDGVWVDGMRVSNLFVYDADGAPLTGVQVVDDRGRPVRTVTEDGWNEWSLPGVQEMWSFVPAFDANGRPRWNVYPLRGAPSELWEWGDDGPALPDGTEPQDPPVPFAAAPAVTVPGLERPADDGPADDEDATSPSPGPATAPTTGPTATPDPADTPSPGEGATPDPTEDGTAPTTDPTPTEAPAP